MDDFDMNLGAEMNIDLEAETPETEHTETVAVVEPVEEVAEVTEVAPVSVEPEGKKVSTGFVLGVCAGVAGVGYAGYRVGKKVVAKIKSSKFAEKVKQKRFEAAKKLVLDSGYVVRKAELPPDDSAPETEKEAVDKPEEK